jgi:hypothetical protein
MEGSISGRTSNIETILVGMATMREGATTFRTDICRTRTKISTKVTMITMVIPMPRPKVRARGKAVFISMMSAITMIGTLPHVRTGDSRSITKPRLENHGDVLKANVRNVFFRNYDMNADEL